MTKQERNLKIWELLQVPGNSEVELSKQFNLTRERIRQIKNQMVAIKGFKPVTKICNYCTLEFVPKKSNQRFCMECITTYRKEIYKLAHQEFLKKHPNYMEEYREKHKHD